MILQKRDLHTRTFRSFFVAVAGALILAAAFVPRANATVLVYFNFEDAVTGGPPDFEADVVGPPDFNPGGGIQLSTISTNFTNFASVDGLLLNRTPLDIDNADPGQALGLRTTPVDNGKWIEFPVDATSFHDMSLSFAVDTAGNGFNTVTLSYSINGGGFIDADTATITSGHGAEIITFTVPSAVDDQANVVLRLTFDGGTSNGNNLQTVVDNIQLIGVPEPTTVAGGLLGVLGLCWHQRRRLVRSVRFRRA